MDEAIVFGVLILSLVLFVAGRWRYDIVAVLALLILTIAGIVPAADAFKGFGHPAVITVAAVLILSRALYDSGVVDVIADWYARIPELLTVRIAALSGITAFLSAFMNNVGAVSLLMPVAIRVSNRSAHPPSRYLMPLAFASLLGGMTTLIGTPPNIIISDFRQEYLGATFSMFDFTLVGVVVTLAGILFITLVGWRLIPERREPLTLGGVLDIGNYMTELRVPDGSRFAGKLLRELEEVVEEDVAIAGLLRQGVVYAAPSSYQIIDPGDILIVEADADDLRTFMDRTGFELEASNEAQAEIDQTLSPDEVSVVEAIVGPDSPAAGRNASDLHLHSEFGVNLMGVSRRGARFTRACSH